MDYRVLDIEETLKSNLAEKPFVILQAPPGAGKSTVLPLRLLHEPWLQGKKIIMLEPRRLAAKSVAMRMADLLNEAVGQTIGYRVRFETKVSNQTRLEVVTEGILTRMIQQDNALENVALLIFDEFHERSLHADLALALSLQVQQVLRADLRILIMSATLDADKLASLLGAPVITSQGRQFKVDLFYTQPDATPLHIQVAKAIQKALRDAKGDILVFLPGAGEINRTVELLEGEQHALSIHPLYGDLPFKKQQEAIVPHPAGKRKVVLATSIAETSLTIEGVSIVIDAGYSRVPRFDPRSGFTRLETIRVTRDSADQRAGRAGRLGPGVCFRLWSQGSNASLVENRTPEILEADLAPLMLELANWGVQDIDDLTWITPPPPGAIAQAKNLLHQLGALQDNLITDRGKEMIRLPTHPRIAHLLIEAKNDNTSNVLSVATDVAALLEEKDPLPKNMSADLSLRVEMLRRWRGGEKVSAEHHALEKIEKLAASWRKLFGIPLNNDIVADTLVGKLISYAYPERIARQIDKNGLRYKMLNNRVARLQDHDLLHQSSWLSIAQLDAGLNEGKIFLAAPLDQQDVSALAQEYEIVAWDNEREMLTGSIQRRVGSLVLSSKPLGKIPEEKSIPALIEIIQQKGLKFLDWSDGLREWQARVMSLRIWRSQDAWPDVSEENLLKTLDRWLAPFLSHVYRRSDLLKLDYQSILPTILPWELQSIFQRLAPEKIEVPSGSHIKINYFDDGRPPVMEVRLQEVFGLQETPAVNEGRTKLIMHLLSPGFKPVQVTQDLKSFWNSTYTEVRKELRTRYPKHSWPEDPWTAEAVRGARRRTQ